MLKPQVGSAAAPDYGGSSAAADSELIRRIQRIQRFQFAKESGGVFAESQLVKVFLSKIDKCLLDLALPRIIMEFGGQETLAEALAIVEQCDRALCQHNATDLVSLLVDSS